MLDSGFANNIKRRQCEQKLGEVHHGRANASFRWDLIKRTATV
jgi:hypothetical protein